jgi:hypothetical protein
MNKNIEQLTKLFEKKDNSSSRNENKTIDNKKANAHKSFYANKDIITRSNEIFNTFNDNKNKENKDCKTEINSKKKLISNNNAKTKKETINENEILNNLKKKNSINNSQNELEKIRNNIMNKNNNKSDNNNTNNEVKKENKNVKANIENLNKNVNKNNNLSTKNESNLNKNNPKQETTNSANIVKNLNKSNIKEKDKKLGFKMLIKNLNKKLQPNEDIISEKSFDRLLNLQTLLKKESALKELCKIYIYNKNIYFYSY